MNRKTGARMKDKSCQNVKAGNTGVCCCAFQLHFVPNKMDKKQQQMRVACCLLPLTLLMTFSAGGFSVFGCEKCCLLTHASRRVSPLVKFQVSSLLNYFPHAVSLLLERVWRCVFVCMLLFSIRILVGQLFVVHAIG